MLYASYFYYRTRTTDWPPGVMPPYLKWGILNAIVFVVSLAPAWFAVARLGYVAAATVLSLTLVWLALRFASDRSERSARALFLGSIAYLPLLWAVMILDH